MYDKQMREFLAMTSTKILLLLLVCSGLVTCSDNRVRNIATKEVLDILRNPAKYDKQILPLNATGPVDVDISMFLRKITVDDANRQVTVDLTFRMMWNDPRLSFKTPGVEQITLMAPELAWIPDAFFVGAVSTEQQTAVRPENYLKVSPNGNMLFSTRFLAIFNCPMDFARFPHDSQEFLIDIASYGYNDEYLRFGGLAKRGGISITVGLRHTNKFEIGKFVTDRCTSITSTGVYSCVRVMVKLNRHISSYVIQWYIPCVFLVVVAAMSEIVVATEFLSRLVLIVIPLITLWMFSTLYTIFKLPTVTYTRPIDIFSGISLLVIFCQLIRVMVFHYYGQRKIKEKNGEIIHRKPRKNFLGTIIDNANFISKITLLVFYGLFLLAYCLIYFI